MRRSSTVLAPFLFLALSGCKKDEPKGDVSEAKSTPSSVPSASASAGSVSPCASPGEVADELTKKFIPQKSGSYCIDPAGETRTYGDHAKFTMDQVCTTAFDGECEVYKSYSLKRLTTFAYVDGAGKGSSVEVKLSEFATPEGAFGMYTKRVVADQDPAQPKFPRPVAVEGSAALGSGVSYLVKGRFVAELTYLNEQETPDAFTKSADLALPGLMKGMASALPGPKTGPAPSEALPREKALPNGLQFFPKGVFGVSAPSAVAYYKDGEKRYRGIAIAASDAAAAFKSLKGKPGALPVAALGDEASQMTLQEAKGRPKSEYVFVRKGGQILGIGDEELVLDAAVPAEKQATLRLSKDEKVALLKTWLK